jgi:CheY-like chemotaxis protein
VRLLLQRSGWTITTTGSARHGLKLANTMLPDVIVCDAVMPELSGPELIESLKSEPITHGTPIVLMTAYSPEMFADVPWNQFLAKPFDAAQLHGAIEGAAARAGQLG